MAVSILSVSLAALLAGLITFVYKLITIRSHFAKLRKNGLVRYAILCPVITYLLNFL